MRFEKRSMKGVRFSRGIGRLTALAAVPLSVAVVLSEPRNVTMRDLEVRGFFVDSAPEVRAVLRAGVATPFGRIPVNAHVHLIHNCGKSFRGTVAYHPLVKLMARLRGMQLVQSLEGLVQEGIDECAMPLPNVFFGRATVDSVVLNGWLRFETDSLVFDGPAWLDDAGAYHADLIGSIGQRKYNVQLKLATRPLLRPAL